MSHTLSLTRGRPDSDPSGSLVDFHLQLWRSMPYMRQQTPPLHKALFRLASGGWRGCQHAWSLGERFSPIKAGWYQLPDGRTVFADPSDWISANAYRGLYERPIVHLLRQILAPGDRFLDVGAHRGVISGVAAVAVGSSGSVVAIEPDPEAIRRLLELAALLNTTVDVWQAAATDSDGQVPFVESRGIPHSGHGRTVTGESMEGSDYVEAVTVDRVWSDLGKPSFRAMKVDTEGGESAVFSGAEQLLQHSPPDFIVAEFSPQLGDVAWLDQLLNRLSGYSPYVISDEGLVRRQLTLRKASPRDLHSGKQLNLVVTASNVKPWLA